MVRNVIFISHATPEDNEFAIWIASRLEMLGYKVWLDKKQLLGGETTWQEIQDVLDYLTIKVLFIYSKNIRDQDGKIKQGIYDEIFHAKSKAKINKFVDFIIPLHIDNSSYSEMIGFDDVNHIPFVDNWAQGLVQLKAKLEKDIVPKDDISKTSSFSGWYESEYINCCKINSKEEAYYSTWWKISKMPDIFYIHVFKTKQEADLIRKTYANIPFGQIANSICTFENDIKCRYDDEMLEQIIIPIESFKFAVTDIERDIFSDVFPTNRDIQNHFKNLLNDIFFKFMKTKKMQYYRLSKDIAYFLPKRDGFKYIKFSYPDSLLNKQKKLGGKYYAFYWHYAISLKPILSPIIGYSLSSHLIFTQNGIKPLEENKIQSYRRTKAKLFFNAEWRDLLLAFIQYLKDENNEIGIKVSSKEDYLFIALWPEIFLSDFGYIDPVLANTSETSSEFVYHE